MKMSEVERAAIRSVKAGVRGRGRVKAVRVHGPGGREALGVAKVLLSP